MPGPINLGMNRAYSLFTVKEFDDETRTVAGIATTPTPDRMGDIVEPKGAQFSLPLPLLWQHDSHKPVGHVLEAKVSDDGITVRAQLAKIDEPGALKDRLDEAWQSLKTGLVRGFSIGFRALESARINDTWSEHFLRWDWLELSLVTIPANAEASITAIKSADQILRAASGAPLRPVVYLNTHPASRAPLVSIPKGHPSMKTIAEQIASLEAKRAASAARREAIQSKAVEENRTKDGAEKEEFDNLSAEISSIDSELKDLKLMESQAVSAATPVQSKAVVSPESGAQARGGAVAPNGYITVQPNVEKGIPFVRYMKAMIHGMFNPQLALMYAQGQKAYADQTPQVIEALRQKANVVAGSTTNSGWASQLVYNQNLQGEFIELVRPLTIIGRLPGLRRVPFNVRMGSQTSGSTGYWVGQGKPVPASALGVGEVTLGIAKAAGLVVITDELLRSSDPNAEVLVRDDLVKTNVDFLDEQFIAPDYAAVANVSPASITSGVTPTAASGTALSNLRTDVQTLLAAFITNQVPLTGLAWVMHPVTALAIANMQNALGQNEFPTMGITGGTFFGLPAIASENCIKVGSPVSGEGRMLVLVNASEILLADDGMADVEASREASIQMLDNPTNDTVTPTATTMVSMWQTNSIAIRAVRYINWAKRRSNVVQFIQDAAYVG